MQRKVNQKRSTRPTSAAGSMVKTSSTKTQDVLQEKNIEAKRAEKFAAGICFKKLFFIFLIGSVIGAYYEQILHLVQTWWNTGTPVWALRRGVIYGPFNVVYGFGAVAMVYVLMRKERKWWQTFLYAAVLGGLLEYAVSFLQEFFIHTTSWDYSQRFMNINGRTTVPFMLFWGLLGVVLVYFVYPPVSRFIECIPPKIGEKIFIVLLVFMLIDLFVSWTALARQTLRHNNVPAFTPVGEFYDAYYTDEFLLKYFPNMVRADSK